MKTGEEEGNGKGEAWGSGGVVRLPAEVRVRGGGLI